MSSSVERRRGPRAECARGAELLVRSNAGHRTRYQVRLSSVSASGARVSLLAPAQTKLLRQETVTISLPLDKVQVELPAQVVRFDSESRYVGLFDVGLRLLPELAPAAMRQSYELWVALMIRDQSKLNVQQETCDEDPSKLEPEVTEDLHKRDQAFANKGGSENEFAGASTEVRFDWPDELPEFNDILIETPQVPLRLR